MKRAKLLTSVFIIGALVGCSYMDLATESPTDVSVMDDIPISVNSGESLSYYYFDQKISLEERQDLAFVKFNDGQSKAAFVSRINSGVSMLRLYNPNESVSLAAEDSDDTFMLQCASSDELNRQLEELRNETDVVFASRALEYEGNLVAVSDEFSVKLKSGTSRNEVEDLARGFGCAVFQRENFGDKIFFIKVDKTSEYGVLQLASAFYETGLFEFTSPDFYTFDAFQSQDTHYSKQWNLKNIGQYSTSRFDINIEPAWEITEGSSDIVVAVLDNGVSLTHPDLAENIIYGYDCALNVHGGAPNTSEDNHGTPVAGIIAAIKDNGIGISGVAPGCKILPVRLGSDEYSSTVCAAGFNWAVSHGADVINCSWGGGTPCSLLSDAIENATMQGRDGKGCVVVFSAGNKYYGDNEKVSYPGWLDYVMAVGAISYNGKRKNLSTPDGENWWSSNYDFNLDVMAPGVFIPATDVNGDYNFSFGGTSGAAPQVAGVAALILSKYPNLPQEYVRRAIEQGCEKLSGYSYTADNEYPALYKNQEVGYGLVDAYDALICAKQFQFRYDTDNTPGFDFIIRNSTLYDFDEIIFDVTGDINGSMTYLVSTELFGSRLEKNSIAGYPVYRGCDINAAPGTQISNIEVRLYAVCSEFSGKFDVGVAFDAPYTGRYDVFSFGSEGNTYETTLPSITVPNGARRKVYLNIYETANQNQ